MAHEQTCAYSYDYARPHRRVHTHPDTHAYKSSQNCPETSEPCTYPLVQTHQPTDACTHPRTKTRPPTNACEHTHPNTLTQTHGHKQTHWTRKCMDTQVHAHKLSGDRPILECCPLSSAMLVWSWKLLHSPSMPQSSPSSLFHGPLPIRLSWFGTHPARRRVFIQYAAGEVTQADGCHILCLLTTAIGIATLISPVKFTSISAYGLMLQELASF